MKSKMFKDKQREIEKTNEILLKKMLSIDTHPSVYANLPKSTNKSYNLSIIAEKNQKRIFVENNRIQERLRNVKSYYKIRHFQNEHDSRNKRRRSQMKLPNSQLVKRRVHSLDLKLIDKMLNEELERQAAYNSMQFLDN